MTDAHNEALQSGTNCPTSDGDFRDQHVAEWIRLTEEAEKKQQDISPQPVAKLGRRSSGVRKASRELGVDREDARRAVKVASLSDVLDEIDRKLWEIAENLHRSELTAKERAEQIAEWVRLAEEKRKRSEKVSAQVGPKPNGRPESGINAASRELGMKERSIRRADCWNKLFHYSRPRGRPPEFAHESAVKTGRR